MVPLASGAHRFTGAAAGTDTVATAKPVTAPVVAEMLACPAATAVTTPDALTVATAGLRLDHVYVRPCSSTLLASYDRATSVAVDPTPASVTPATPADVTLTRASGPATRRNA